MTSDEQAQLKAKIESKIVETKRDVENLIDLTKPIPPENAIGRISRMDAINNKSVNESALRKSRIKLKNLEWSLNQFGTDTFGTDTFGTCINCKSQIAFGRLMFMPESVLCIKCARR